MNNKLYIANLPTEVTETELKELFATTGAVLSASIATDKATGNQRGFAFVEMSTEDEAKAAVTAIHGKDLRGNAITVNISTPKPKQEAIR